MKEKKINRLLIILTLILILIILVFCSLAKSETIGNGPVAIRPIVPTKIIIQAGKGQIEIGFDGKIKLVDVNLDEASRLFWEKIGASFPEFKKNIIEEYKKESKTIKTQ